MCVFALYVDFFYAVRAGTEQEERAVLSKLECKKISLSIFVYNYNFKCLMLY